MKICAAIENDNVDFRAMGKKCVNSISEKCKLQKAGHHTLTFVRMKLYLRAPESPRA